MLESTLIRNYKEDKEEIINYFNNNELLEAKEKLDNLSIHNETYYSLYSIYYYLMQEYDKGIELLEGLNNKIPFSYEITYNLANLKCAIGEFGEGMLLFARCVKLACSSEDRQDATEKMGESIEQFKATSANTTESLIAYLNELDKILKEGDERTYPINRNNESLVKRMVEDNNKNLYFTEMYKSMRVENVDKNTRYFFKNELLQGKATNSYELKLEHETTVPIALFTDFDAIFVEGPNVNFTFPKDMLNPNQFNYFTFSEAGKYKFYSKKDFFIANPINLKPKKNDTQVIVSIFIDGLANTVIENDFEKLMPNTYRFFSKGYINNNCYTTGDWTLPSVSSMYTGKTTMNHGLYHPTKHYELNKYNRLFSENFKEHGYFTAQINNDWRVTPTYGYLQGMDRIVYQAYSGGFAAGEVVAETIEHLETFKNNNHFLWVSLMDLHDVADEIDNDLMSQVKLSAKFRQQSNLGETSVLSKYDPNKIEKYTVELKRIDLHLTNLLNYLETTFGMDNILVSLVSDHGQTYLKQDDFLLHEPKRKVPFMLAGKNIKPKVSEELCSIIDIYPTIAKLTGVKVDNQEGIVLKDFGGLGREMAMTETLHPNQPYLVSITDEEHIFRFNTKEEVNENTLIDLEFYEAILLDKKTLQDVTASNKEKLEKYCEMVICRASKLQI